VGTFTVSTTLSHPERPEHRLTLDLIVDTGATYSRLPTEVVQQLSLDTSRERPAVLASGERVTYRIGLVTIRLHAEEWPTMFLAGPPGCPALLGAITLEAFGLAADPVNKRLVPVVSLLG